jgi:hypothetical protein
MKRPGPRTQERAPGSSPELPLRTASDEEEGLRTFQPTAVGEVIGIGS